MSRTVLVSDFLLAVEAVSRQTIIAAGKQVFAIAVSIGHDETASINWQNHVGYGIQATIYFPASLDPLGRMPQSLADAWCAYWVHEIGHALYTDKAVWTRSVNEGLASTVNALEDIRIEGELIRRGVAINAKGLLEALCNGKLDEARAAAGGSLDFVRNFEGFLCYAGREAILGYALGIKTEGLAALPPGYQSLAADVWARVSKSQSTEEIRQIAHWLRQQLANMPKGNGKGEGEKGEGEKGEGSKGNGKGSKGEGSKGPEGEGSKGPEGEGSKGPEGEGSKGPEGESKGEKGEGDIADGKPGRGAGSGSGRAELSVDLAPRGLGSKAEDGERMNRGEKQVAASVLSQASGVTVRNIVAPRGTMGNARDLPLTSKLDRDVAALVKAPAKTSRQHHRDHGRLSRRDTSRALQGAKDVFALREFTPAKNTAVLLLVDMSSSMAGREAQYAEQGARMLTRAIERAGGLVSVAGFIEGNSGVSLRVVKPFGKRAIACDSSGLMSVGGGTPMSPAIIAGTKLLLSERTATRRILLVLTDGACNFGMGGTRFASRYAKAHGVEIAALGIGCDPGAAFPISVSVSDIGKLGEAGLGTLLRTLKKGEAV